MNFEEFKEEFNGDVKEIENWNVGIEAGDLVEILSYDEILNNLKNTYISVKDDYEFWRIRDNYRESILDSEKQLVRTIRFIDKDTIYFDHCGIYFEKRNEKYYAGKFAVVTGVNTAKGKANVRMLEPECGNNEMYVTPLTVKVIERNYIKNKKEKYREYYKTNLSKTDTELEKEMISKVDIRKMKRILSASLQINANEIKGLPNLLKEWASAKKELYLLLGRQLKVTSVNEFEADFEEKDALFRTLKQKFPRRVVCDRKFPT